MKLDSLVKLEISKNWKKNGTPLTPDEVWKIRAEYTRQNDSMFISQLNQKIKTAAKRDVTEFITHWLDEFNKPNLRKLDSTWHHIMAIFYNYDRESCKEYCGQHQLLVRRYAGHRFEGFNLFEPYPFKDNPYMVFLYKNYRLTEVLPIIMMDNDLDEFDTMRMAKFLYQDFSRNRCMDDTICIESAREFIKNYFILNKDLKPKEFYLKTFEVGSPFLKEIEEKLIEHNHQKIRNHKKN